MIGGFPDVEWATEASLPPTAGRRFSLVRKWGMRIWNVMQALPGLCFSVTVEVQWRR